MQIFNCGRGVHAREVVGIARLRALPSKWYAFTNLDLALAPGKSRELDVILVADDRIFLLDLKDWAGRIESQGGRWLHNGRDCGHSPVAKIHENAKDIVRLIASDIRKNWRGAPRPSTPRIQGLVVITAKADLTRIAATERSSVIPIDEFLKAVVAPASRVTTFSAVPPEFVQNPLTGTSWKQHLGAFFNVQTGPFKAGQRRYGGFTATSDAADFKHPHEVYAEYQAVDQSAALATGTLRIWDFTKVETRFQSEEGRAEIVGRERDVIDYLCDRSDECEAAILLPKAHDPDRGVGYWEIYDRRKRMKRMTEFVTTELPSLSRDTKVELARQVIAKVAALHAVEAAHLDVGSHSLWLQAPSTVKLSHFMVASFPQVRSLGERRYQFLASARVPEDALGGTQEAKRKDVFLLGVSVHHLLFGCTPASELTDLPPEWSAAVDTNGSFADLHPWFERMLALVPSDRFSDAIGALAAFNSAVASRPTTKEVLEGLDRFRSSIRTQIQLFTAAPLTKTIRDDDSSAIWRSTYGDRPVVVKLWKRASWADQIRDGPRILDFLTRAQNLILSPPANCAVIREVIWLGDAIALIQDAVEGDNLADSISTNQELWRQPVNVLRFLESLAQCVITLHEGGLAHGDLKPHNIVVVRGDRPIPVLIDIIDFTAAADGEIKSSAYAPGVGGSYERDRFAVTKVAEELLSACDLDPQVAADIARSVDICRSSIPANGTLLPLLEALDRALAPAPTKAPVSIRISIWQAKTGPVLPDEGLFYLRRSRDRNSLILRGACEEIEVFFDSKAKPVRARRRDIEQKLISMFARYEFMSVPIDLAVDRADQNEFSGLESLLADPDFVEAQAQVLEVIPKDTSDDEQAAAAEVFEEDALSEAIASEPAPTGHLDIVLLWRSLIDAERDLTTDGVAVGDSSYRRDLRRHVAPFDLETGTFDFARDDRVLVKRPDRKGRWHPVGYLDIPRSRPDFIVIDTASFTTSNEAKLLEEGQRLRFESHFEITSLKRRESAIGRVLSRESRIPDLIDVFDPRKDQCARLVPTTVRTDALQESYNLNPEQAGALSELLRIRPVGLLQGPPGTGKTIFIAALVHYALTHGMAQNVLLASQSHEAVNNAAEAVLKLFARDDKHPSILRVGNEAAVSDRLLPYHAARVEQLYKDRFQASLGHRLAIVGHALGVHDDLIQDIIAAETALRPLTERITELEKEGPADTQRIAGLRSTLRAQIEARDINEGFDPKQSGPELLDDIINAANTRPGRPRASLDQIAQLRSVAQLARDFMGSVSTRTRSFETFLAGTRQIVAGTCVGLGRSSLELTTTPFDLVVVDEAARCTASELSVPIQAGRWVVLVGDQAQLEPQHKAEIVQRVAAEVKTTRREVVRSDFERVFQTQYGGVAGRRLTKQYRMLPPIGRVVSTSFYGGALEHGRTSPEIEPRALPPDLSMPITWIATDALGEQSFERREAAGTSFTNPSEADVIIDILKGWEGCEPFCQWLGSQTKYAQPIGIICTYAAQRDLIRRKLQTASLAEALRGAIKIDTVDSYQGKENPIVLLSLVRNNADGPQQSGSATIKNGFLSRPNRINVAISRAMDRLVIVGAHHRWPAGGPMARLADAVDQEVSRGEARIDSVTGVQEARQTTSGKQSREPSSSSAGRTGK